MITSERLTENLLRAHEHWNAAHERGADADGDSQHLTIALSRETGTYGAAIAREVGNRLVWPVYDSELLQHIADDLGVHRSLLDSVDEKDENWLSECLEGFFGAGQASSHVSGNLYFRRLLEAVLSLARHGNCVIVGRGATSALPQATTLRVRIVAPLQHRIEAVQRERNISRKDAASRVEAVDRERNRFVASHFGTNPTDPANYDLVLSSARFSTAECADLIVAALEQLRAHTGATAAAAVR